MARDITNARQAKINAALNKLVRYNGAEFITRRALIERLVTNGSRVSLRKNGERVLLSPDGSWLDAHNITITGLDYAYKLSADLEWLNDSAA